MGPPHTMQASSTITHRIHQTEGNQRDVDKTSSGIESIIKAAAVSRQCGKRADICVRHHGDNSLWFWKSPNLLLFVHMAQSD